MRRMFAVFSLLILWAGMSLAAKSDKSYKAAEKAWKQANKAEKKAWKQSEKAEKRADKQWKKRTDNGDRYRWTTEGHRPHDRNGDGLISRNEWPGNDQSFRQLDRDGDGVISSYDRGLKRNDRDRYNYRPR